MTKRQSKKPSRRALETQQHQRWAAQAALWDAYQLFQVGQRTKAEMAAREALRLEPGNHAATILLAELLMRSRRFEEMRPLVLASLARHPTHPKLNFILANAAVETGRLDEAHDSLEHFHQLLAANPDAMPGQRAVFLDMAKTLRREIDSRRLHPRQDRPSAAIDAANAATQSEARAKRAARVREVYRNATRRAPEPVPDTPAQPVATSPPAAILAPSRVAIRFESAPAIGKVLQPGALWSDALADRDLLLASQHISLVSQFEDLLCLPTLAGVQRFEYQVETARKILRRLNGRALLCDEVGLGKTIEAGMVMKELLLRGLAQSVLVVVPAGLVGQWRAEMQEKFGLEFTDWSTKPAIDAPANGPFLRISSIALARHERNFDALTSQHWDLVVVDEAHHLRRRTTRSWAFVNALHKRYLLLLSATPVHNNLMELYEMVTLVKPGLLGTPADFRRKFIADKQSRSTHQPDALRVLLSDVMVRNTRSHADVALPRRFATTFVLEPNAQEAAAYRCASDYARHAYPNASTTTRRWLQHLLGCAGSGPRALADIALRRLERIPLELTEDIAAVEAEAFPDAPDPARSSDTESELRLLRSVADAALAASQSSKADRLLQLLAGSEEQMIIFCRYRATLTELSERLSQAGTGFVVHHGGLSRPDKDSAIARFRDGVPVLLSTESGGEGRNIQFCRTIVNYDLPWDPMSIEQRIGRVHRIGQTRDVFVFNLALAGTIEEEMLRVLEEKIHLFELIVGEVDSILGHLDRREDFADIVLDLWVRASGDDDRRERFTAFGKELDLARSSYEQEKSLGDSLFADDLEV